MTRALRLVLARGFELPGVEVVQWTARVGNWASRRVAERCGQRLDGWIGSLRRGEPFTGRTGCSAHRNPSRGRVAGYSTHRLREGAASVCVGVEALPWTNAPAAKRAPATRRSGEFRPSRPGAAVS